MKLDKYSENIILVSEKGKVEQEYWINKLQGEVMVSSFPKDCFHSELKDSVYSKANYKLPDSVCQRVNQLSNKSKYAAFMILLAGVKYLLYKYTGNPDILVGMPAFKQKVEGEFAENVLALRTSIESNDTFKSILGKIKNTVLEVDKNQNYPLFKTAELLDLQLEGDKYRFNTIIELEGIHSTQALNYVNADIKIVFSISEASLEAKVEYDNRFYREETINQIIKHLTNFFEITAISMDMQMSQIEILSENEKKLILNDFNITKEDYSKEKTINQIFEEQVEKTPERVAVVFEGEQLTYTQLNDKANQLARVLRRKGVKIDNIVGIMLERSIDLIVGILGVLKSGGVYLPIDPQYPKDRIKYMLEDSKTKVILTKDNLVEDIEFEGIVLDITDEEIYEEATENLTMVNKSNDLAYVIYTSGSTGKPKGVMLEHIGISSLKEFFSRDFGIKEEDRITQFASSSFDASVWEIFMALLNGASLYIVSRDTINSTEKFEKFIDNNKITVVTLPPTYLANLKPENVNTLKRIITAGSAANKELVNKWKNKAVYINAYGPTETTICATTFICDETIDNYSSIPIGKPIFNTKVLILDKNNKLVPLGVAGELCIAGDSLARGYLNKPELTAEKFTVNPYAPQERIYHTGDLARWFADGNVEFLGRIDHQVKIRGYRIELGEIEAQLLKQEHVNDVLVMAKEDKNGDKYLCAYIACEQELNVQTLRDYLAKDLPEYMIPSYFIKLSSMPLTPNGKVDRKALPEPDKGNHSSEEYVAPRTEIEEIVAKVWQEVLGVELVGIKDNFFELGGDSIKAIQVVSRLKKHSLKCEVKDMFSYKTIEGLSNIIVKAEMMKIEQGAVNGEVDLTSIQQWYFEKQFTNMEHWNQSVMLYGKNGFDAILVEKTFKKIVEHHDALRMVYKKVDNRTVQYNRAIDEGEAFTIDVFDLIGHADYKQKLEEEVNNIQASIDMENGPLVKLALFKTKEGDHLLIVIHHLVVDGVSWRIIFEDFTIGYNQLIKNEYIKFQEKTNSYKEWATGLKKFAESKEIKQEVDYWSRLEAIEVPLLPVDIEETKASRFKDLETLEISFNKQETEKLLKEANKAYSTEINDILLTALGMTIKQWTNIDKVLVSLEGHGREEIIKDIDITRTVGWFTSQYPVLLDMSEMDISYLIRATKEELKNMPNKGIGYGILRYLSSISNGKLKFRHNPEICFNYLGQFGQDINTDLFSLSNFNTGQNVSPESENNFKININGMITGEKLVMAFSYSRNQYNNDTIIKLMEAYKNNLISILEHCVSKDKTALTPSDIECKELSIKQFDKVYDIWGDDIKSIYKLSPTQEGMLFHAVLDTESHTYFQQIAFEINGYIDVELLEKSFNIIIERHDILRTNFIYKSFKRPLQVVLHKGQVKVHFEDITNIDENSRDSYIEDFKLMDRNKGFDLSKEMLIRLAVLKSGEQSYKFMWSFHHILMDGWCLGIINKELFETYTALKNNVPVKLQKAHNYRTYIDWLEKQDNEEAKDYWTQYLGGYENRAAIPQTAVGHSGKYMREEYNFVIDKEITEKIGNIAKKNNTTTNIVLQSIWGLMLQRYNNTRDVVFGAVMSGRRSEIEGIEEIVGLFINTVPVRVQCDNNTLFTDLLSKVQEAALLNEKYSYYPLVEIQEVSPLKGALLDHIMVFENYPIEKNLMDSSSQNNIGFAIVDVEAFQQTNYDFGITMFPGEDIIVRITFNGAKYDKEFINNIEMHIKEAAAQVIEDPTTVVGDIGVLGKEQTDRILFDFNNTKVDYPHDKTISQLLEQQVQKTPDNRAVVFENTHLTYKELNEKANQLARLLITKGVRAQSIVGIMVKPSLEMIVGIFGILKAGAAYLPMDPEIPAERIKQIADDSGINILLTENSIINDSIIYDYLIDVETINLEDETIYSEAYSNLDIVGNSENTVYVIYTSGTTGKPKGVQLKNSCLANYTNWFSNWVNLTSDDKAVLVSSFAFDLGYTVLYSSLLNGCELHLLKKERYSDPEMLTSYIEQNKITYIKSTPSLFNMIVNNKGFNTSKSNLPLRLVVLGGEQINLEDIEKFHNKYKDTMIVNHYGPTETTIGSIAYKVDFNEIEQYKQAPVIGKPINNTEVYILDETLNPVPVGVTGEIHISGAGVSKGYLNRPDITEEKFVPNPFSKIYNTMYKTGDLGRFNKCGSIEFLGRKDHQVKIRGYRIELSEIIGCLLKDENIKDAIVIAKDDDNIGKYLCAYIVHEEGFDVSQIRTNLAKELPDYMIPSFFIALEKLPLTANGKVDRKALPEPHGAISSSVEYVAPRNEVELIMVEIWQEVLNIDNIGIEHNFFEMGGHSLKLINLVSRVYEAFDVELSPKQVLEAPTISKMAERLAKGDYKDQHPLMLLNSEMDKKIFCFPPVGGYGLVYKNLADISKEHSYYSFNYIDDSGKNLSQYVDYIMEVQKEGPYTLMGWSAGGNLAFEVAKEMENQGHKVADIILVDVHRMISNMDMPKEEIQKMVNDNLKLAMEDEFYKDYLSKNEFIKNRVAGKMEDYFTYLRNEMINSGEVSSNIHVIYSTDQVPPEHDLRGDWDKVTTGNFTKYQGVGSHPYMLYTGFVEENSNLIRKILSSR